MTLIHYITYNDAMSSVFLLFMEVKVKINFKGMKICLLYCIFMLYVRYNLQNMVEYPISV